MTRSSLHEHRWFSRGPGGAERAGAKALGEAAIPILLGALVVYLAFNMGGFFPAATGAATVVLALALVLRLTLAERPFAGVSAPVLVAAAALALLAVLTLLSGSWSGAPARALLEFDRTLLYLLALVLFGSVPLRLVSLEFAVRAFAAAALLVCSAGLTSRVAPDVLSASGSAVVDRLGYPLGYWNALGLLAVLAGLACLHLASGARQPAFVRGLGAAAIPPLAVTLLLTFSRGAIGAGLVALVVYLAVARPWGALGTVVAVGPTAAVAVIAGYRADQLATITPTSPAAVAQGHDLALVVVLCALGAGVLRAVLGRLDVVLERRAERAAQKRSGRNLPRLLAAGAAVGLAVVILALAFDVPDRVGRQVERFRSGEALQATQVRDRLTSASDNGRLDPWRVALDATSEAPLVGHGAGTYQILWARDRATPFGVVDGHSLYLETLAELGVVGLALIVIVIATLMGALAWRARGRQRSLYGALFAALVAWALHAGVDWHWEMPVVTVWLFALGGLAIATPAGRHSAPGPAPLTRIVAALGCLVLAVTPALVALSQRELDASVAAFRRGDCAEAVRNALDSASWVGVRPQPFELLAYCDVRAGLPDLAVRVMRKALARDPENWEYRYGLAIVRATAGLDPRPQLREALRLNPRNVLVQEAARALLPTDDPAKWRRRALRARLPLRS